VCVAAAFISSCGLRAYKEPSIEIRGVTSQGNYDVRNAANILINVKDPGLQKIYVDITSDGVLLVDSLVETNSDEVELEIPWEPLSAAREPRTYEVVVTAFNENTFGRKEVQFSAFNGFDKEVWHLMWTESAIYTLKEDYSTLSNNTVNDEIDTIVVTPQYASYLVLFKDRYELRDIKTHGSLSTVMLEKKSRIAADNKHIVLSQIVDEQNVFYAENMISYSDQSGQILSVMPGRLLANNYKMNPELGYVMHSTRPGVVYFQYPAPVDLVKVFHQNRASFLTFNQMDRDFALVHDNANYQLLELHQSNGRTTSRMNLGSHIKEVVDFATTTLNAFILERDRLRIVNLESMALTEVPVMESVALYCDYYGDIPYLIYENEVHLIDDHTLETKTITTASETIRGFETLYIR